MISSVISVQIEICRFEERINLTLFHRVHWLAKQGLAIKSHWLAILSLFFFILFVTLQFCYKKGKRIMRNNKSNIVRDIFTNIGITISGNMASSALLANVL